MTQESQIKRAKTKKKKQKQLALLLSITVSNVYIIDSTKNQSKYRVNPNHVSDKHQEIAKAKRLEDN